jgi:hypothetical protein
VVKRRRLLPVIRGGPLIQFSRSLTVVDRLGEIMIDTPPSFLPLYFVSHLTAPLCT